MGDYMQVDMDDVEYISETSLTIRGSRRRTTVPKPIVDKLRLKNGNKIRWILFKDGNIAITKVKR
jgi:bifunctional DNA-binding transcriptional regulator/antitoxin component of YhaV-PrlF toxin-antitoxin module